MEIYVPSTSDTKVWISLGEKTYAVRFYEFRGATYVDVIANGETIIAGARVIANQWILPSYMEAKGGNFRFETYAFDSGSYVHYSGYNEKFRLNAYDESELKELS